MYDDDDDDDAHTELWTLAGTLNYKEGLIRKSISPNRDILGSAETSNP